MTDTPFSTPVPICPLCDEPMNAVEVHNALSRYIDRYICSPCGTIEAFALAAMNRAPEINGRECLYFDEVAGIMLVNENQPGYSPLWPAPPAAEHEWVCKYVDAVNTRVGISIGDQTTIVGRSMMLGGVR